MAASYSGDPRSTPKDAVRFLIRDMAAPFSFTDEEIMFILDTEDNHWMAAAVLGTQRIVKLGGLASKSVGGLSESYSSDSTYLKEAIVVWKMKGSGKAVPISAYIPQIFEMGQFDNPAVVTRSANDEYD